MWFSYVEVMIDFMFYILLVKVVEVVGYSSMMIFDSIVYFFEFDLKYLYIFDGNCEFMDGKFFIEIFVLIVVLGVVMMRLWFNFFVFKLFICLLVLVVK